ncbi:MAG: histidine--tRNA ligase [Candidatus Magasanikbacteria bacterium]|jgi:histidyl-tRNA synthetase
MPKLKKKFVKSVKKPEAKKSKPASASSEPKAKTYALVRGMHDILPRDEKYWKKCFHTAEDLAAFFQFGRIETPLLEETGLFVRSLGRGTDVVDKEMYAFEDKDGSRVCLRPEATASIARAFINSGMWNAPQPVKLWYWGPMFRHDRPQAGRYRQFFQAGFEVLGMADPAADAEIILVAFNFYKDLGIPVEISINSIGSLAERDRYKEELVNYYRSKRGYLCAECKARLNRNPLRLLDCKEKDCQPVKAEAPKMIDWLGPESSAHFTKVLEYLDELGIPYNLCHTLVRGLDYYNNTVFEVYPALTPALNTEGKTDEPVVGQQGALGGGGRYDGLIEQMGGRATPGLGMALGIDRSILAWKQHNEANKLVVAGNKFDIYFAQLGEDSKRVGLRLLDSWRLAGLKVGFNFGKNSLKSQMEIANNLKVPFVIILGQKEVQDQTVIIRDMESGVQEVVDQKKAEATIKKKLEKI